MFSICLHNIIWYTSVQKELWVTDPINIKIYSMKYNKFDKIIMMCGGQHNLCFSCIITRLNMVNKDDFLLDPKWHNTNIHWLQITYLLSLYDPISLELICVEKCSYFFILMFLFLSTLAMSFLFQIPKCSGPIVTASIIHYVLWQPTVGILILCAITWIYLVAKDAFHYLLQLCGKYLY